MARQLCQGGAGVEQGLVQMSQALFAVTSTQEILDALMARRPKRSHEGQRELVEDEGELVADAAKLATGKARLELQWTALSPKWQQAFPQPIIDALEIYFRHDALASVSADEVVTPQESLPSQFVLVNKTDPKNHTPWTRTWRVQSSRPGR